MNKTRQTNDLLCVRNQRAIYNHLLLHCVIRNQHPAMEFSLTHEKTLSIKQVMLRSVVELLSGSVGQKSIKTDMQQAIPNVCGYKIS